MKLSKKWENKTIYRTSRGTVVGKRQGELVIVEVGQDTLLSKYLKILYKFENHIEKQVLKKEKKIEKKKVVKETSKQKSDKEKVKKVSKSKKK